MHDFAGEPVNNALMQAFDDQRSRGTQGFGIYDGQEDNMVHETKEDNLLKWLVKYPSSLMLMHHRFPTSTVNVRRAAHPFSTKDYFGDTEYILVHNGSIRNSQELYADHWEMGVDYHSYLQDNTFNDSEALLWDFAMTMEKFQPKLRARGGIAFIALKLHKGKLEKMYFGRNTNPLRMIRNNGGIALASELQDGDMIESDTLYTWHYKSKRLTTKEFEIPGYITRTTTYQPPQSAIPYRDRDGLDAGFNSNCTSCKNLKYACITHRTGGSTDYSTLYDCNCNEVGWARCDYHGYQGNYDDYDDDHSYTDSSYDNSEHRMRETVGNVLRRQFGTKFGLKEDEAIDYKQDPQTKLYLPAGEPVMTENQGKLAKAQAEERERRKAEDKLLLALEPITDDEVAQEFLAYLAGAKGHFESAYWSMEWDYDQAQEASNTKENIRKRRVLEMVMERLDNDPENINANSISSVWRETWQPATAK